MQKTLYFVPEIIYDRLVKGSFIRRGEIVVNKKEIRDRSSIPNATLCLVVLVSAFVYSVLYGFTHNPMSRTSTLSWIGYDYPISLIVWSLLTAAAYFFNLLRLYKRSGCTGKTGLFALYASVFAAPPVVFINDWGWEQTAHLVATAIFVLLNSIALIGYFLYYRKRHWIYPVTAGALTVMMIVCVVIHAAVLKNGLTELIPIWTGLILLFIINFTDIYPAVVEKSPMPHWEGSDRKAFYLAAFFGVFGVHDFYLKQYSQGVGHLLMTYTGLMVCICRYIGLGNLNNLQGEQAWMFVSAGLSILGGSLAWAVRDAFVLHKETRGGF